MGGIMEGTYWYFNFSFLIIIPNSMQELHALSHLEITFQKAPSQYQHVSLKQLGRQAGGQVGDIKHSVSNHNGNY